MTNDDDRFNELIHMAVPHDFSTTLRYLDDKSQEIFNIVGQGGPLAQYTKGLFFYKRIKRIREIINELDYEFEDLWENEAYHKNYVEMEKAYSVKVAPKLEQIIYLGDQLARLLERMLRKYPGMTASDDATSAMARAEELTARIKYFSGRSLYYVKGLIDLSNFTPVLNAEHTNLNRFFDQQNEFFQLERTGEEVERLNDLPTLKIDYSHCYTLFSNLIKNSLKYKRGDGAIMRVLYDPGYQEAVKFADELPDYVPVNRIRPGAHAIHFFDYGIGIEEKKLFLVFRPFKRGFDRDEQSDFALRDGDNYEGGHDQGFSTYSDMGIGLAMAERVVELYGGTIYATSQLGTGTCITIELPLRLLQ